jgi:hypothetical protein
MNLSVDLRIIRYQMSNVTTIFIAAIAILSAFRT